VTVLPRKKKTFNIKGWAAIRRRILERDLYMCRICGKDVVGGKLNVHHKDYKGNSSLYGHNDKDDNLVTLCSDCHKQVHKEGYRPDLYMDWPIPWGNDPI